MTSPAREAAFQVLRILASTQSDLGDALSRIRDPLRDPRDRALVTDLVLGSLRHRGAIDYQLQRFSDRPLTRLDEAVLDSLRLAAYQIIHLQRVPVSAVVNDAVSIVKGARLRSAAPFANAVLRRLARERDHLVWPDRPESVTNQRAWVEYLATVYSHPAWLVERWLERYGAIATENWLRFNNQPPVVTLATNRLRIDRSDLVNKLHLEGVETTPTSVAPYGLSVSRGQALRSRTFRDGYCLIQDEASQLITELVKAELGSVVLDVCASPGGKTIALAAQVGLTGLVVAADVRARRVRLLKETITRCQAARVLVAHLPATGSLPLRDGAFSRVLVDAPCSGLGTVRRDPDIRWRRTEAELVRLARQQVDLLRRVAPTVAPGGRLIYATCSSEPEENEAVVSAFLEEHEAFRVLPIATLSALPTTIPLLSADTGYFRSHPAVGLEAFFGAVLEKRSG
jgi:16S rRNA (cytosine967-C5)-methyltransferase